MKHTLRFASPFVLCGFLAGLLSGCHEDPGSKIAPHLAETGPDYLPLEQIFAEHNKTAQDATLKEGIDRLLEGEYHEASKAFNTALLDNPSSSWLHYLNGLAYHLMARSGDVTRNDLAVAGFEQALKFDPTNALASLQLGRVRADQKRYLEAQEEFANVLLLQPDHSEALYELAAVSYKMGDLKTARMAIDRVELQGGATSEVLKAKAMILAATGKGEEALAALAAYRQKADSPLKTKRLETRLKDWKSLYENGLILAQFDGSSIDQEIAQDAAPDQDDGGIGGPPPEASGPHEPPMIVLDAVVMRVDDIGKTSKGQNILDNFTLTLAPGSHFKGKSNSNNTTTGAFAFFPGSSNLTATHNATGNSFDSTKVFTQGISFGTITYSMKIANVERQHIEVIGRPSLVASIGKPAKFFSGRELALGLSGEYGGTISKLPVGVTLKATPLSFDGQTVVLDIMLYGSLVADAEFLDQGGTPRDTTKSFTRIGISKVKTTVKAKLGETIMLAGITERIDEDGKSGFPVLQDIPGLQYLFSSEATLSERKSVMYLITPRAYDENKRVLQALTDFKDKRLNLKELEMRHKNWYDPDHNMAVTLKHLFPLYREFRQGDLDEIDWSMKDRLKTQAEQAASFFYY